MRAGGPAQVAQLALKHRQNKNQRQRIVVFAGSPIAEDEKQLVKVAKKLKKSNVAVDIVHFGGEPGNQEKLEAFHSAVNSNDNSNIVEVPPGSGPLSDSLLSTPIFGGQAGGSGFAAAAAASAAAAAAGGATGDFAEFGVDPNLDPELALVLRMSMEEERARQEAAARAQAEGGGGEGAAAAQAEGGDAAQGPSGEGAAAPAAGEAEAMEMDDDALLQQALAMSMAGAEGAAAPAAEAPPAAEAGGEPMDADLALALQMSVEDQGGEAPAALQQALADPEYVQGVLGALPGVDPNDPAIQAALKGGEGGGAQDGEGTAKDGEGEGDAK